jgi:hypothetical protein
LPLSTSSCYPTFVTISPSRKPSWSTTAARRPHN